jgi:hypothetical protein
MRILGSVVAPSTSLVALRNPEITGCSPIRSEIIRDEPFLRAKPMSALGMSKRSRGGLSVFDAARSGG